VTLATKVKLAYTCFENYPSNNEPIPFHFHSSNSHTEEQSLHFSIFNNSTLILLLIYIFMASKVNFIIFNHAHCHSISRSVRFVIVPPRLHSPECGQWLTYIYPREWRCVSPVKIIVSENFLFSPPNLIYLSLVLLYGRDL